MFGNAGLDFGDAPDPPYPTLLASDGARHVMVPGFYLGAAVDGEPDGQPSPAADGDDLLGMADEDGVTMVGTMLRGNIGCVDIVASAPGKIDAWIDFDNSGVWGDSAGEQIFSNRPVTAGTNALMCFTVPGTMHVGPTWARFRFSTAGGLTPYGLATSGEIEDHGFTLYQFAPTQPVVLTDLNISTGGTASVDVMPQTGVLYQLQVTDSLLGTRRGMHNVN